MIRKTLTPIGSSLGLVIEKPILDVLGINRSTVLNIDLRDGALVIQPELKRGATSQAELDDWIRSLVVRVGSSSSEEFEALEEELSRCSQVVRVFAPRAPKRKTNAGLADTHSWLLGIIEHLLQRRPAPEKPIVTREIARAILEELSESRGTFREVTASRSYAHASPDLVAQVLWYLVMRGFVEVHSDSRRIRPLVERLWEQGRGDAPMPDVVGEALKNGITLLRLSPAGGEYLHELRRAATE